MRRRGLLLLAVLGPIGAGLLLLAGVAAVLSSPTLLTRLARPFGYEVSAHAISLSPPLSGALSGLSLRRLDDGLTLSATRVAAATSLPKALRGEVDSLVLQSPRLTYRVTKGPKGELDLSVLERLPAVRRLQVQDAQVQLTLEDGQTRVDLSNAQLTVNDFSVTTGGSIAFQADFALSAPGETAISASGTLKGRLALTGFYPRPYGQGAVEVAIRSGTYTSGGQTVSLGGLTGAAELSYDRRTETVALTALRGQGKGFGTLTATGQAVLRGEMPWHATVSAGPIDFAQVFALLRPLLPETYRAWTMQGEGAVDTKVRGTYAGAQLSLDGDVTFSFSRAGVSSPDGSTAAQAVGGSMTLRLQYAAPERRLSFDLESEHRAGEYLWGAYYTNLVGQRASLTARGAVRWGAEPEVRLAGALDAFQTGRYSLRGDGTGDTWEIHFAAADVSHARILDLLLKDRLAQLTPALAGLSVSGGSSLEGVLRTGPSALAVAGTLRTTGTTVAAPALPLMIQALEATLPFDLRYPPPDGAPARPAAPGFIRFDGLQLGALAVDGLRIPVRIRRNALEIPEPLTVPLLGGQVRLSDLRVDDVLFPDRGRAGVVVRELDLGQLSEWLTGTAYPGRIEADLGTLSYRDGRVAAPGAVTVRVFGGEVEARNLFAENLTAPSRRLGADIAFRRISLEEVTRRIAVGKMSGMIQGSIRQLVVEAGQPGGGVLEVESVETPGVEQWISVDAIQSISILGTGAGSALNRGITQFFRQYPYSRIGFRCTLKNDQFSVRGTIHEGGKEYLVRRAFLRGVDVVNQNPDNVISFRDMRERLARIARRPEPGAGGVVTQ